MLKTYFTEIGTLCCYYTLCSEQCVECWDHFCRCVYLMAHNKRSINISDSLEVWNYLFLLKYFKAS